jgi:hypothetical protein
MKLIPIAFLSVCFAYVFTASPMTAAEPKAPAANLKSAESTPGTAKEPKDDKTKAEPKDEGVVQKPGEKKAAKAASARPLPYQATVYRVSEKQNKFTTRTKAGKVHTFHVTEKTVFLKDDREAKFADLKAGEVVRGTRYKRGENEWEAVKVIIGEKKKADGKEEPGDEE